MAIIKIYLGNTDESVCRHGHLAAYARLGIRTPKREYILAWVEIVRGVLGHPYLPTGRHG